MLSYRKWIAFIVLNNLGEFSTRQSRRFLKRQHNCFKNRAQVCLQEKLHCHRHYGSGLNKVTAMLNKKHKILVVDDEPDLASTLATILRAHRYDTATANSGEEAVQVARSLQPECIVSDVMMGAMNGIEAAIEILAVLPQCKVLLMSGNAPCRDLLENAIAKGFNFEVLQKPVPPLEMLARISQIVSNPAEPNRKPAASESSACIGTQIRGSRLVGR
jgi:CheY-like chemotaxis protein